MGMFDAIDAAASGLTAERLRLDVITNNIANANTTRTPEGGAYKRKLVLFEPREQARSFAGFLSREMGDNVPGRGVRAVRITTDETPGPTVFSPGHPDANPDGYVEMPNLNIVSEMVDMITASRAYEANTTAINTAKAMATKALDIGK